MSFTYAQFNPEKSYYESNFPEETFALLISHRMLRNSNTACAQSAIVTRRGDRASPTTHAHHRDHGLVVATTTAEATRLQPPLDVVL
ncbi:hypothetical protein EVAR_75704_1 [Eumeta japonica]|uniref:Uncharacterized protein n=1 Tax=Eumeta variegata TaxID=151549 RepID=A0A4C1W402_EUMVA|nr:hypothetical protein EVAR_75704_1 [Eumeta japonica]